MPPGTTKLLKRWRGWLADLRPADRCLLVALALATFVYFVWLVFHWGSEAARTLLGNLLSNLVTLLAVVLAWRGVTQHEGYRRWGWTFVALGLSTAALGDFLWSFQELVLGVDPFPSIADLFYLLFVPFFLLSFYTLARLPLVRRKSARLDLDALILIAAAGVLSWRFFFAPLISEGGEGQLTLAVSLAYPALDLVLFSLMILMVLRSDGWRSTGSSLYLLGIVCFLVADVAYTIMVAAQAYTVGHPVDFLWVLSTLLFALAAWADRGHKEAGEARVPNTASWAVYLPYLGIAVCYALLFAQPAAGGRSTLGYQGVLFGTALVTLLVVTRQVLTLRDNQRLSHMLHAQNFVLEERVRERTAGLEHANRELRDFSQTLELKVQQRTAELEASRALLAHQAHHDILTGLPNRAFLEEHLQLATNLFRHGQRSMCLFFIDLDGFKQVNDTYGHETGDLLLRDVANRLRNSLRSGDVAARLGGDEFVVLLPVLEDPLHAEAMASRLLKAIQEPFFIGGHTVRVGASVGASLLPQDADDVASLQRHADIAMYQAKHAGKNSVRFYGRDSLLN